MKIVLVNGTEIPVLSASGALDRGLVARTNVEDQAAFMSLVSQLTDENVAQISIYDGDNLIGQYANQNFLSVQMTQFETDEGETSLIATITTKGQDATIVRLAAVEEAVDQLVEDALMASLEEV